MMQSPCESVWKRSLSVGKPLETLADNESAQFTFQAKGTQIDQEMLCKG